MSPLLQIPKYCLLVVTCAVFCAGLANAAFIPQGAINRLGAGQHVDLIVEYEASAVYQEASAMRRARNRNSDDAASFWISRCVKSGARVGQK